MCLKGTRYWVSGENYTFKCLLITKYYSADTIERNRWAGNVAHMGERKGVYRVFVGKPEGKRPLGRHRRRWEYNIKMKLQEVGCGGMDWMIWLRTGTGGGHL